MDERENDDAGKEFNDEYVSVMYQATGAAGTKKKIRTLPARWSGEIARTRVIQRAYTGFLGKKGSFKSRKQAEAFSSSKIMNNIRPRPENKETLSPSDGKGYAYLDYIPTSWFTRHGLGRALVVILEEYFDSVQAEWSRRAKRQNLGKAGNDPNFIERMTSVVDVFTGKNMNKTTRRITGNGSLSMSNRDFAIAIAPQVSEYIIDKLSAGYLVLNRKLDEDDVWGGDDEEFGSSRRKKVVTKAQDSLENMVGSNEQIRENREKYQKFLDLTVPIGRDKSVRAIPVRIFGQYWDGNFFQFKAAENASIPGEDPSLLVDLAKTGLTFFLSGLKQDLRMALARYIVRNYAYNVDTVLRNPNSDFKARIDSESAEKPYTLIDDLAEDMREKNLDTRAYIDAITLMLQSSSNYRRLDEKGNVIDTSTVQFNKNIEEFRKNFLRWVQSSGFDKRNGDWKNNDDVSLIMSVSTFSNGTPKITEEERPSNTKSAKKRYYISYPIRFYFQGKKKGENVADYYEIPQSFFYVSIIEENKEDGKRARSGGKPAIVNLLKALYYPLDTYSSAEKTYIEKRYRDAESKILKDYERTATEFFAVEEDKATTDAKVRAIYRRAQKAEEELRATGGEDRTSRVGRKRAGAGKGKEPARGEELQEDVEISEGDDEVVLPNEEFASGEESASDEVELS